MDSCQIIYYLCILIFCYCYYNNNTWINVDKFKWHHLIFLLSCLLLFEKYDMVPSVLRCPPFYMVYKVIAALVVANAALFTVFYQVDDILHWLITSIGSILSDITGIEKFNEYAKDETTEFVAQMLVTSYLLLWVLVSSGYIPEVPGVPSSSSFSSLPQKRSRSQGRRRSKVRC